MVTYRIALGPELDWLPDDTEESLLGNTVHQSAIVILHTGLDLHKSRLGLPWLVTNKLPLIIPRHDGGTYQPAPDILVHPTLGDALLDSLAVATQGSPALVMEITSPDTAYQHDLDTLNPQAKPLAYEQAAIPEYLAFDPIGDLIPEQIRAWHLGPDGHYTSWLPHPITGRWHSALGISFAPQGLRLRVYDADGNLIPTVDESERVIEAQAHEMENQARRLEAQDDQIAALQAELRRLRGE
jgi:hypothetical protein